MNTMKDERKSVFTEYDAESPVATELRRIYQRLGTTMEGRRNKSFLLTSSSRGEGKSTITSYLALTISQFPKKKVLVVDADLRRPMIHRMFGVENQVGLKECLADGLDPLKAITPTQKENLHIITAGSRHPHPSSLFETGALAQCFEKLNFYYDVVLIDSAPVLPVADTLFLCNVVQSVLFVVMAGVTPADVVVRGKEILEQAGTTIEGVIVNNASDTLPYYYGRHYYGYDRNA
jgi:protein-tyrosine kinase